MLSEDYFVRQIMQFVSVIAKVAGLKMSGQYQVALEVIDQSLGELLGINADMANLLDDESLYKSLTINKVIDLERLRIVAELFKEKGDILNLQKHKLESNNSYLRSLNYYLLINSNKQPSQSYDLTQKINELILKLVNYDLPEKTILDLFCFYENEGEYAKAENILTILINRPKGKIVLREEMISFYQRLLLKSQKELSAGGMNKKQIRIKLKDL
jgi:hypothetical protein